MQADVVARSMAALAFGAVLLLSLPAAAGAQESKILGLFPTGEAGKTMLALPPSEAPPLPGASDDDDFLFGMPAAETR